jgi:XTP/dITP diphosphohydrolase
VPQEDKLLCFKYENKDQKSLFFYSAKMNIVFATNNQHKLLEIRNALGSQYIVLGLNDCGIVEDIPETKDTIEENAIEKVLYIYNKYYLNCFADDTGLEVEALGNRPGVFSARYAGPGCCYMDNVKKLLIEMKGITNRKAKFRTVIAYIEQGKVYTFEGIIDGLITNEIFGDAGFGYDPVFKPVNSEITFAEMPIEIKNKISHRAIALRKFIKFLSDR